MHAPTRAERILSFRDLVVWRRSIALAVAVYGLTEKFPRSEVYGLISQMRRAAVSVSSNIAEGHSRTTGSFLQFLLVAKGSNSELQTQIIIARALGFGESRELNDTEQLSIEVAKLLSGLIASLRRKQPNP